MIDSFTDEYKFLSNFYFSPIKYEGHSYRTVEHAFQAAKTEDEGWIEKIRSALTPGAAKRLGQHCPLIEDWDVKKMEVMIDLIEVKFTQHRDLQDKLLATGEHFLVEGNTWGDKFWGVCNGEGINALGFILMMARYAIRLERQQQE